MTASARISLAGPPSSESVPLALIPACLRVHTRPLPFGQVHWNPGSSCSFTSSATPLSLITTRPSRAGGPAAAGRPIVSWTSLRRGRILVRSRIGCPEPRR